jgi:hypothetical protein
MFDRAFGEGETEMKKAIATQTPVGRVGTAQYCGFVHPEQRSPRARTSLWTVDIRTIPWIAVKPQQGGADGQLRKTPA